jgi:hypothetical protein
MQETKNAAKLWLQVARRVIRTLELTHLFEWLIGFWI